MTLMQTKHPIAYIKYNQNLELATFNKNLQITWCNWLIFLINKNKKVKIWYCRFKYDNNAKIIKVSKFWIIMGDFNKAYGSIKIYNNFK